LKSFNRRHLDAHGMSFYALEINYTPFRQNRKLHHHAWPAISPMGGYQQSCLIHAQHPMA
jgi:hypothetical protein